jgi:hypothetical protein
VTVIFPLKWLQVSEVIGTPLRYRFDMIYFPAMFGQGTMLIFLDDYTTTILFKRDKSGIFFRFFPDRLYHLRREWLASAGCSR